MSRAIQDPPAVATISLLINSKDRVNPASSPNNCTIFLNRNVPNVRQIELAHFQMLNSMWAFTSANDIVPITEGATTTYVAIPNGTYDTGAAMAAELQTALNAASLMNTYTVTFSSTTLLLTISATGSFSINWATAYAAGKAIASRLLGFGLPAGAVNYTSSGSPEAITSIYPLQSYNENELGIQMTWTASNFVSSSDTTCTWCIPVDVPFGQIISFRRAVRADAAMLGLGQGVNLGKSVTITLIDPETGQLISNPSEWNMKLLIVPLVGNS